jgi:hypothetical protein
MKTDRIEQALRTWELCCANSRLSIKRINMLKSGAASEMAVGPAKHFESFRNDILARKPFDAEKYIPEDLSAEAMGPYSFFPTAVHAWATDSRRIYTIDEVVQQIVMQTNVSELTWKDIPFPFNSFGIALAQPIREPDGQLFDFLLVHRGFMHSIGHDGITIWMISQEFERPEAMPLKKARAAYEDMIIRGNLKPGTKIMDLLTSPKAMSETTMGAKLNALIADGLFFDKPLQNTFDHIKEHEGEDSSNGLLPLHGIKFSEMQITVERIVAGLCVYLDANRGGAKETGGTSWTPLDEPTMDNTCVTKASLVCMVQNVYDVSGLKRELLLIADPVERDRRCKELGVHYREGYARRRPGFGDDPTAPRCVHIPPTIVGLRRLPLDALPRGTEKVL